MALGSHRAFTTKVLFVCSLKPVVVLTDLMKEYTFFWLDGHIVRVCTAPSSSEAWGLIDLLLSSEEMTQTGVAPKTLGSRCDACCQKAKACLGAGCCW